MDLIIILIIYGNIKGFSQVFHKTNNVMACVVISCYDHLDTMVCESKGDCRMSKLHRSIFIILNSEESKLMMRTIGSRNTLCNQQM